MFECVHVLSISLCLLSSFILSSHRRRGVFNSYPSISVSQAACAHLKSISRSFFSFYLPLTHTLHTQTAVTPPLPLNLFPKLRVCESFPPKLLNHIQTFQIPKYQIPTSNTRFIHHFHFIPPCQEKKSLPPSHHTQLHVQSKDHSSQSYPPLLPSPAPCTMQRRV
jgi:hypothetical protein